MPPDGQAGAREDPPAKESTRGASLRMWRERALLTQEQLAARTGLNVRTIRRLESGELRRARSASVRALAEALDLNAAEVETLTRALSTNPEPSRPTRTTPRQLPTDVAAFVGRGRELSMLTETGDAGTIQIIAIDGMAGVGKTALAVHAAHRLASRFPDGDLFVDLQGYTEGMAAADPADALARVLEVLGVPGESIPQHLDDRAALYRSLLASRKMLIVLDNATDEAQVRPLLPGAGSCLVLVTSRRRLVGLDDARLVSVDILPLADAIALFTGTAGQERVADAPHGALAEVVRRCGLLPLAIRLAAARLKAHPAWSVAHLLERLEEQRRLLSELRAGQRSVTAALNMSYQELAPAERRAYRLLGLHAGADIPRDAAAALLGATVARTDLFLDRLLEAHLLQEPVAGRYRFHDLIRAHAAATAIEEEPEADRRAALARLLDHYGQAASTAMDRLYPYEADTRPRSGTGSMPDAAAAAAWLDAELANLLSLAQHAAEHGFPGHVQHLSTTLHRCLRTRGRYAEAETLHTRALSAARAAADRTSEMEALLGLVEIRRIQGRYDQAVEDGTLALDIARAIGHRSGELRALNSLAATHIGREQRGLAAADVAEALRIAREIGHRTGELDALIISGNVHRAMGENRQGATYLTEALRIAREIGHRTAELRALIGLGYIHLRQGELTSAAEFFTQSLSLARDTEHRVGELSSRNALGHVHRLQRRHEQAGDCYRQVACLAREIGNRNWQFEAVYGMGRLHHDRGRYEEALDSHRQALGLATELCQASDQARAHDGLAHAYAALGEPARARHHWTQALTLLTSLGIERMDEDGVDMASIRTHLAAS
ncbi:ATP-binding protein [Thermoactinospora rubra]|uniref:ATP-binding protein n=1 Tax=Thermoactinospora rubra TaxID=1088767 RepID=UPI000A11778C|nr:tetratricopeptide repeat protein [Thermoactinospora rubra]